MQFNRQLCRGAFAAGVLCIGIGTGAGISEWRQEAQARPQDRGPDLVGGLRATPGCLGVETAETSSGMQCIFAWFENKKAVGNWYYSEMHLGAMDAFMPDVDGGKPMEGIADDEGPILVIASLTPSQKPAFENVNMPISQIAIELYKPLPGGAYLGTRFAPMGVIVEGLVDFTPPTGDTDGDN